MQDFEIIVVGGNSTDSGENIVREYNDLRIHLIKEAGNGVSSARNQGVDLAHGGLVAFLDADDEWLPEFLETVLRLRGKFPEAGLYGTGYQRFFQENSVVDCCVEKELGDHLFKSYFHIKNRYPFMVILTSGMVIPKNIFNEIGGFPLNYSQNEDMALRAKIALSYPVAYSPQTMCSYRVNHEFTYDRFVTEISDPFSDYVYSNPMPFIDINDDYDDIIEFCDRAQLKIALNYMVCGKNKRSIWHVLHNINSDACQINKLIYFIYSLIPYAIIRLSLKYLYSIYILYRSKKY